MEPFKELHTEPNGHSTSWIGNRMPISTASERESTIGVSAKEVYHSLTRRIFLHYRFCLSLMFRMRNLLRHMDPLSFSIEGLDLLLYPKGSIAFNVWTKFQIERRELELMLRAVDSEMTFFDVGANVGIFTLVIGKKLGKSGGQVYSFEPCAETCAIFQHNLRINRLTNVHLVQAALTDQVGEGILQLNAAFRDGLNTLGRPTHSDCRIVGSETVSTTTIDRFMEVNDIRRVDVLKVDAEGAELLVFMGARKLLGRPDAPLILYEGYSGCTAGFNYHPGEIMSFLKQFGYQFFVIDAAMGGLILRPCDHQYDQMIVALKPADSRFEGPLQQKDRR
ncbi:MAG: FkbM family methyltransferase [Candidatus Acidiferrales bacterium]